MHAIVDGTTAAMGVEVCSFYLADHERTRLTLAATNGLDRSQVGKVSLAWGEGITGRVAASREPIAVEDVTVDTGSPGCAASTSRRSRGCSRCRSCGTTRWSASSTSRPATSTRSPTSEIDFLTTIAALLAGIVEKGRLTAEVEGRLAELTALDAARAELLSVVTHELRTPLSVVRVYVDLLGDAAAAERTGTGRGRHGGGRQRPAGAAGPARGFDPGVGPRRGADGSVAGAVRCGPGRRRDRRDAPAAAPAAPDPLGAPGRPDDRHRRRDPLPAGARAAARERVEVRARPTRA